MSSDECFTGTLPHLWLTGVRGWVGTQKHPPPTFARFELAKVFGADQCGEPSTPGPLACKPGAHALTGQKGSKHPRVKAQCEVVYAVGRGVEPPPFRMPRFSRPGVHHWTSLPKRKVVESNHRPLQGEPVSNQLGGPSPTPSKDEPFPWRVQCPYPLPKHGPSSGGSGSRTHER